MKGDLLSCGLCLGLASECAAGGILSYVGPSKQEWWTNGIFANIYGEIKLLVPVCRPVGYMKKPIFRLHASALANDTNSEEIQKSDHGRRVL